MTRPLVPLCYTCGSPQVAPYNHVKDFEHEPNWPVIFALDPHPRKPHMWLHIQVDPNNDLWQVSDGELNDEPVEVRRQVTHEEQRLHLNVTCRLMDPNMGRSPSSAIRRDQTWQDEFAEAGLVCDLASDSDVGRGKVNEYLKPDEFTHRPRLHIHPRCERTIYQIKRYTWDEFKHREEKDVKQKPREKYDDYPTLLKYVLNFDPDFQSLRHGGQVIRRPGRRTGAY